MPVLNVENLTVEVINKKDRKTLVDHISFSVKEGKCLGILGESGSGKSMTGKAIMGLLDRNFHVSGDVQFEQQKNLLLMRPESMRKIRGKDICMILQNPMTCFDPLYRIGAQMSEGFAEHTSLNSKQIYERCIEILEQMKIRNPEDVMRKYPHQLSGGMLQRIMIGLALSMKPKLIIADEPTTAIDSITQYDILEEFIHIKNMHKVAMIFISHDLGVITKMADDVIVMHNTKIVQRGKVRDILNNPQDAYTRQLVTNRLAVMKVFDQTIYPTKEIHPCY